MTVRTFNLRNVLAAGIAAVLASVPLALSTSAAVAETQLRMILNWKYEGPQGMFFLAADRGYFKELGLAVSFDQGNGSGAAVPQVANGAYDLGFGDINALIELAAKKPDIAPLAVAVLYEEPPFTIAVKADSAIKTAKDLEGKTIGGAANDGALKLFPAFCTEAKIDCSSIKITNFQPNLREQLLMQGQVDGVFGYINTIRFAAERIGVKPDTQLRFIRYADYGLNLYSNSIIVSRKLVKENPAAVKGFLIALFKGIHDAIKDPDAAIAAVAKREPLIKQPLEREKFLATLKDEMNAPEVKTLGLGAVDPKRLEHSIEILVKAEKLPRTPTMAEVFDPVFLPPLKDRPTDLTPGMHAASAK